MLMQHDELFRQSQYYRHEMMRSAENERLVQQALGRRQNQRRFYRPLFVWAGHRMVRLGLYLMSQAYGVQLETRTVQFRRVS